MNITKILFLLHNINADLIGWNRYSGLVAKKYQIDSEQDLVSHQDAIIQQLVKRNNYSGLREFIRIIRQSHRYRRDELLRQ